ncbi:MAG: hypothetical protein MUP36_00035 [Demequinaceae bacterium]|nr:hypothetical protein [Demequinaceae bacterium]
MHDMIHAAVDRRARAFAGGAAFAEGHESRIVRSIRGRQTATRVGAGAAVIAAVVGAAFGLHAWSGSAHTVVPGGQPSASPDIPISDAATKVSTTLVLVPMDDPNFPAGETGRLYVYYASAGATDMVPFPASGIYYPGISDVPSDAIIVALHGDADGYDLDGPGGDYQDIGVFPVWSDQGDLVGDRSFYDFQYTDDGQNASIMWDVVGYVSSDSRWGIHYFIVNGKIVTEVEGRANPDAIEVTAMFDPAATG